MAVSGKESNSMEKIASFQIHHETLLPGVYVSRVDRWNGTAVTTLDLRLTAPNREPVVDVPALHTIEHLGATFLRSSRSRISGKTAVCSHRFTIHYIHNIDGKKD